MSNIGLIETVGHAQLSLIIRANGNPGTIPNLTVRVRAERYPAFSHHQSVNLLDCILDKTTLIQAIKAIE